ncbi:MAG: rod-binding protein [Lachnospiraceae bacterium]|nr:rod-binding protein [Lachnospiraceae bacterium]
MSLDVSSMINQYTDFVTQNAQNAQAASKVDTSKDYSKATDEELMDACKKFEAYFLEQCMKEMMKTVQSEDGTTGIFGSGSNNALMDYYKDNMISELATQSTERNSLGLAQMLYEQMKRNYDL